MSKEEKQLCHCEGTSNPNKRARFAKSAGIGAVLLTALSLFASCTQDEISGGSNDDRPSTLALGTVKAAGIDVKQVTTRAVATTDYPTTDSIGFFVKADAANGYVACDNRKGKYSTARQLWLPVDTIWLNKHDADIAIYAPYDASHTTPATLNLTAALRPADGSKDIWCKHITANNTSKSPAVTLEHVYSRLYLTVTRDATYTADASLTALDVKGDEVYESATYKPFETAPYTYSSTTGLAPTVTAQTLNASTASATYDLLLIPTPLTGDITLTLTVDGKKMEVTIDKTRFTGSKLDAGKQYNVGLALKPGKLDITSVSMVKWDALPEINGGQAEFEEAKEIDIGLNFLIAPGNVRAVKPAGSSTYEYSFAEEQGYSSGDAFGGDYFCWNTLDPSEIIQKNFFSVDWDPNFDPCRQVGKGEWHTPSSNQLSVMIDKGYVRGTYTMSDGSTQEGMYFGTTAVPLKTAQDNYVFLPAAGKRDNTGIIATTSSGYYWTTTTSPLQAENTFGLSFETGANTTTGADTYSDTGMLVRCVKDKPQKTTPPAHAIEVEDIEYYVADGNVRAISDNNGGYTYQFAEEQGYYSGDGSGGDYFCWNTLDPTATTSNNTTTVWDTNNDPCRKIDDGKWYTPTTRQLKRLSALNSNKNTVWGTYTMSNNTTVNGMYFGTATVPDPAEQDKYLFLPAAGYRDSYDNAYKKVGTGGYYQSTDSYLESSSNRNYSYNLNFTNTNCNADSSNLNNDKRPLRCVRDK